jgi:transcriptional regulator with XRE-family HTH domain
MSTGQNIKKIREEKGMTQQQIAELISMHRSNYSKIESGQREISVEALNKVAKYFGMTIDQIVNFDGAMPQEITIEDKMLLEQVRMIQDLEDDEKNIVFKMVDTFLTKKKFKDFFKKNVAIL